MTHPSAPDGVEYTYDAGGRMTVQRDAMGGETTYTYDEGTGLLTKVRYYSAPSYYDANYAYDDAARLVKVTDWIDGTDGIRYAYDGAGGCRGSRIMTIRIWNIRVGSILKCNS